MKKMTGGEAVVKSLIAEGVEVVFGIPSVHSVAIYDALYRHPEIRLITTRHEQGATHMADGYARASGKPGVCITSTGPGACNSMSAMGEAYAGSLPILNITTQNEKRLSGKEKGATHDNKDQSGMFRSVTGWNKRVESITDIPSSVHEAFRRFKTQRPRPIALEFPTDILQGWDDVEFLDAESYERAPGALPEVTKAAECLANSKRPVIWAGGGVISAEACAELVGLAELLQAPVLTSGMGKTVMSWDHPMFLGRLALGWGGSHSPATTSPVIELLRDSDVMLAVGTRFNLWDTRNWTLPIPNQLIQIDIDKTQFGKNYPCKVGIAGDAKAVLEQLLEQLGHERKRISRGGEIRDIKEAVYKRTWQRAPAEMQVLEDITVAAGPGAILSLDANTTYYWAGTFSKPFEPRTEMGPWGFAGLGFAFPAAIGAKVACPKRPVVVLVGDGGFLFTGQELATALQFGINVVVIIFDDSCYGTTRAMQKQWFDGHYIGVDLCNPDFVKFAEAFGIPANKVSSLSEIKGALEKALSLDTTSVIVVSEPLLSSVEYTGRPSPMQPMPLS